jgi:hypothetical protein
VWWWILEDESWEEVWVMERARMSELWYCHLALFDEPMRANRSHSKVEDNSASVRIYISTRIRTCRLPRPSLPMSSRLRFPNPPDLKVVRHPYDDHLL